MGTAYSSNRLTVDDDTSVEEVRQYAKTKALEPTIIRGVTVWNFSSHKLDVESFRDLVDKLDGDRYIIPYQVQSVWAYMVSKVLPRKIRNARMLVYSKQVDGYTEVPNHIRESDDDEDRATRAELANRI